MMREPIRDEARDGPPREPDKAKKAIKTTKAPKAVVGWREWVGLPALGIRAIKAKVDTGARTSSLHAYDITYSQKRGVEWVRFKVHPRQRSTKQVVEVELPLAARRHVRPSSGRAELRPVVLAPIELFDDSWTVELTLTSRDAMGFRMLLGRQAIRNRFVVDPGRSYAAGKELAPPHAKKKKKKKKKKRSASG